MSRKREPEERGFGYDFFCLMAQTAGDLSEASGHLVTWLDLAIDYALSLEATVRGQEPGALRITAKETAEALRRYCGESVEEHLPGAKEITSALREHKYLSKMWRLLQ